ncbi:MAG: MBL fold metallo-hydrolase [Geminicoccaceae bacterium]
MEALSLTLIGGPTVLIETGGVRLLTDPTFDPAGGSYALPHVTLEKLAGPVLAADALGRLDAVLLSHDQHADNLDHAGRDLLGRVPLVLTTEPAAARLGGAARGLAPWQSATVPMAGGELVVTATPARHGPVGIEPLAGAVVGFLLGRKEPGDLLYVTGDTVWYEGVAEVARRCRPRAVLLFAGAARTRGAIHLTMDANDALETAAAFPRARLFAAHTDGWAHFTESGEALERAFATVGLGGRLTVLRLGRTEQADD